MPAIHAAELKDEYKRIAPYYNQKRSRVEDEPATYQMIQKFVGLLPKVASILDLGCGNGRDADWLTAQGYEVTMIDLSPEMLTYAKRRVPRAAVIQGDMLEMHFEQGSFAGVWANTSLLHLTKEEIQVVMKKLWEMLKSGGVFMASFKEGDGEQYMEEDKYGIKTRRFYTTLHRDELEGLAKEAGFRNITVEVIGNNPKYNKLYLFAQK